MKVRKTEPITARLPEEWRPILEDHWSIAGMDFNYSVLIRAALEDYMDRNGILPDE